MSIICQTPVGESAPNCEDDIAIGFLEKIYGEEFISSFYKPGTDHPALVSPANDTIMSLIGSNLASAALIVAMLIIVLTIYKGLISSANDGAAVGLSEKSSMVGMLGRPLFSLAMLAPTVSGYPVIYILIVSISLLANGFANEGLKQYVAVDFSEKAITARLTDQNYLVANDMLKPMFYGALHGFCTKYAEPTLNANMYMIQSNVVYDQNNDSYEHESLIPSGLMLARRTFNIQYKDVPQSASGVIANYFGLGNSGVAGDVCGGFSADFTIPELKQVTNTGPYEVSDLDIVTNKISNNISEKGGKVAQLRLDAALRAYYSGYAMSNGALPVVDTLDPYSIAPADFCNAYGRSGSRPMPRTG